MSIQLPNGMTSPYPRLPGSNHAQAVNLHLRMEQDLSNNASKSFGIKSKVLKNKKTSVESSQNLTDFQLMKQYQHNQARREASDRIVGNTFKVSAVSQATSKKFL